MLVLSRREREEIVINDNIVVRVVSISKGIVRLGITAPDDVKILRSEVRDDDRGLRGGGRGNR